MLTLDDIHVNYGHFQALLGVSFTIKKGEIVALLGSNGAGKSTTINTISGMTDLRKGKIIFEGEDITNLSVEGRVKKGIVQVPEGRKLFPYMTVMDNLLIGSYNHEARAKRKESLSLCFDMFPTLYDRKSQMAGSLSGGEQQMCAVGRAIMSNPKIIMFDEPSLGLAPVVVETVFRNIIKLNNAGMTILLVEQNVLLSLKISKRGYVIETGRNIISGNSEELLNNKDIRKAYLGI